MLMSYLFGHRASAAENHDLVTESLPKLLAAVKHAAASEAESDKKKKKEKKENKDEKSENGTAAGGGDKTSKSVVRRLRAVLRTLHFIIEHVTKTPALATARSRLVNDELRTALERLPIPVAAALKVDLYKLWK